MKFHAGPVYISKLIMGTEGTDHDIMAQISEDKGTKAFREKQHPSAPISVNE